MKIRLVLLTLARPFIINGNFLDITIFLNMIVRCLCFYYYLRLALIIETSNKELATF